MVLTEPRNHLRFCANSECSIVIYSPTVSNECSECGFAGLKVAKLKMKVTVNG